MTPMNSKFYLPAGSTGSVAVTVAVTPESAGWFETSLWVAELSAGEPVERRSGDDEILVVPLSGSVAVSCDDREFTLAGRQSVFDGPTDFAYVGRDSAYRVTSSAGARVAFCGARARRRLPFRYIRAEDVPIELRGAGSCSREVHNFATADVFEADSDHGLRGDHARRQLVVVSAAQARRGTRQARPSSRRSITSRSPTGRAAAGLRLSPRVRHACAADRGAGGGALRRRRAGAARLPRPVDRGARATTCIT